MRIRCYNPSRNGTWIIDTIREFKKAELSEYPHDYSTYVKEILEDLELRKKERIIYKYEIYS